MAVMWPMPCLAEATSPPLMPVATVVALGTKGGDVTPTEHGMGHMAAIGACAVWRPCKAAAPPLSLRLSCRTRVTTWAGRGALPSSWITDKQTEDGAG
jgi:hypothetical protein